MTRKIQFLATAAALFALTFSSCKKEGEDMPSSQSSTNTPDLTEGGLNPDELSLTSSSSTERHARGGFLYTESNATSQNEILCFRQHGDGSLTLETTVASGGTGIGA